MAVSMALLAAAASSARAAEPDAAAQNAQAQNAQAQNPAQPDASEEQTVIVYGDRQSQIRAIELKRQAPSIQDSISAENIGQLPDVTITDALQRITGVQINRDAGVGTTVDVRGLPRSAPC
jgi:outer membrane receptor for Fe3+-dicitrate